MDFSLSLHVLPSWFLLIYLRYNAAVVSTDLSFDWLHHGLEDEGVWRRKCKHSNREEVWRRVRDFSLGLGTVLLQYIYTVLYSSQKDRCLLYRLGLQGFHRFFYKLIFAFNTHMPYVRWKSYWLLSTLALKKSLPWLHCKRWRTSSLDNSTVSYWTHPHLLLSYKPLLTFVPIQPIRSPQERQKDPETDQCHESFHLHQPPIGHLWNNFLDWQPALTGTINTV